MKNLLPFPLFSWLLAGILASPPLYSESPPSILHLSLDGEISEHIDPHEYPIISQKILQQAIYSTLFRFKDNLEATPCLAKSHQLKDQTMIIELNEGARFSDGRRITTRDVISSIERLLKAPKSRASLHRYIEGAEQFVNGETENCTGLEAIDDNRFCIRFRYKGSNLIQYLCDTTAAILPEGWKPKDPVFSGPYTIEKRTRKNDVEMISLRINPHWSLTRPKNERIDIHVHKYPESMVNEIKKGWPEYFLFTFGNDVTLDNTSYNIINMPTNGQFYVLLNPQAHPLDKAEWRVFLREMIFIAGEKIHQHWSGSMHSRLVMPYGLPGYDLFRPIKENQAIRPAQPAEEIDLPIHLNRSVLRMKLYTALKETLSRHRIRLTPVWEHISQTIPRLKTGEFIMTAFYYLSGNPVSINFFEQMFLPGEQLNPGGYTIPKATELIDQYHKEENDLERMRILARLESLAEESSFLIPVLGLSYIFGCRRDQPVITSNRFLNFYLDQFQSQHEH